MIDLIKYVIVGDKAVRRFDYNQYTFDVDVRLTKPKIKQLIEEIFKVEVLAVNTHRPARKKRVRGQVQGYRSKSKRAIVTLKKGSSIPIYSNN